MTNFEAPQGNNANTVTGPKIQTNKGRYIIPTNIQTNKGPWHSSGYRTGAPYTCDGGKSAASHTIL